MLRIRARYVEVELMCLSCALGWPNAIEDWWATPDGMIMIRHRAVIGEEVAA